MIIKLVYNKEIHLFKLENPAIVEIKNHIQKLHPQLNQNYSLFYKDDDGDLISISSDEDLKVLMESVKNQTVKITIQTSNAWTCKNCTLQNQEGIVCEACSSYKEGEPQQYGQQHQGFQPGYYPPQCYPHQQFGPPQQFGHPPQQPPPQFPFMPPQMPPGPPFGHFGMPGFGHPPHMFGGFHHFKHHGHHHRQKWHKIRQIMKDPQFKQQREKLQQLLKEVSQTLRNTMQNSQQQQFYQYQQQMHWSEEDEKRATRLAEVLQCNQEQAREYLQIFRDLTLDEIVMMVENAE
ncbi:unnamed protein product (macronuclear) [Paramecium tetraurelia]|uniref:PB1 domain-containing protein n=1 Tax=Paramecium tetraurelia TaxID=5888 RepID=A0DL42_PARTE|nr:uncharacterized protein GSPATT00018076001 [Paramecium tetraurelia]CAK83759.1 unnamed protein product [Paramecium tetraurelia]|eukprot:XP_001451156.1 hypothetical protein (macronuclear) [Paramecium tetraurelia strain d4-2]